MKKLLLMAITIVLFGGCVPKIVSQKSPLLSIDTNKCFTFPSKDYLLAKPISIQKLYNFSQRVLFSNNIKVFFGKTNQCVNFLITDWKVSEDKYTVVSKGTSYTNSNSTINTNLYDYGYIPVQSNSYTYTSPDVTRTEKDYYGTYTLEIGVLRNKVISTVWTGTQSGGLAATNLKEAEAIEDSDFSTIKDMIERMLKENNFNK